MAYFTGGPFASATGNLGSGHRAEEDSSDRSSADYSTASPVDSLCFTRTYPKKPGVEPGQEPALHEHIATPEDRVYFAGEHASLLHGWIEGAIESGLRAARSIQEAAFTSSE